MPSYTTIYGECDTAAHRADFDSAVNAVGGAAACVGGQSISGTAISQAVNADITEEIQEELGELGIDVTINLSALPFQNRRKPKKKAKAKKKR